MVTCNLKMDKCTNFVLHATLFGLDQQLLLLYGGCCLVVGMPSCLPAYRHALGPALTYM